MKLICPGCDGERKFRQYLCENCWWLLKPWTRTALKRRDNMASLRLLTLRRQLTASVRVEDVEVPK